MKKKYSLLLIAIALIVAAMVFTSCGKLKKGQVYQNTESAEDYICFHSDGNLYVGNKNSGVLKTDKIGPYSIDEKAKKIKINETEFDFELKGSKLTITDERKTLKLIKVSSPTEDEMKKAVKP